MSRQISALASNQLEAWESIARDWLVIPAIREPDNRTSPLSKYLHLVCWKCHVSVFHVGAQSISPAVLLAATVAHLRNMHRELDPDA